MNCMKKRVQRMDSTPTPCHLLKQNMSLQTWSWRSAESESNIQAATYRENQQKKPPNSPGGCFCSWETWEPEGAEEPYPSDSVWTAAIGPLLHTEGNHHLIGWGGQDLQAGLEFQSFSWALIWGCWWEAGLLVCNDFTGRINMHSSSMSGSMKRARVYIRLEWRLLPTFLSYCCISQFTGSKLKYLFNLNRIYLMVCFK